MKAAKIVWFCVASGALLSTLALTQMVDLHGWQGKGLDAGIIFSLMFGAFVGLVCSPLAAACLLHKHLHHAESLVLAITTPCVVIAARAAPGLGGLTVRGLGELVLASAGAASIATALAWWVLPRIWDEPGLCGRCGYDLRGSWESGRCPECGTSFLQDVDGAGGEAGRRKWRWGVWTLASTRPVSVLAVVVAVAVAAALYGEGSR